MNAKAIVILIGMWAVMCGAAGNLEASCRKVDLGNGRSVCEHCSNPRRPDTCWDHALPCDGASIAESPLDQSLAVFDSGSQPRLQAVNLESSHEEHHPPHNMLMHGEKEIFASHIVYKKPHNYQVILRLHLDSLTQAKYLREKRLYPKDVFIYLLDSMNIAEIRSLKKIQGTVYRMAENGQRPELFRIELTQDEFEVLYFGELPLSLNTDAD